MLLLVFSLIQRESKAIVSPVNLYRICLSSADTSANLLWNVSADACSSFDRYRIYGRENTSQSWKLLKEIFNKNTNNANVKITSLKRWHFRITTLYACNLADSFISNELRIDNIDPLKPQLDSISVVPKTNTIIAGWAKSLSADVRGYYLYHVLGSNVLLKNTTNTTASISTLTPNTAAVTMSLAAYDSCGNTSSISSNHRTIFLFYNADICKRTLNLSWSPYIGWSGIDRYEVWVDVENGGFKKITSLPNNQQSFEYYHNSNDKNICLYIRAYKDDQLMSSTSNKLCIKTPKTHVSTEKYLAKVTCKNNSILNVVALFDTINIKTIRLKSKTHGSLIWTTIQDFPANKKINYDDNNSTCTQNKNYLFELINYCDSIVDTTHTGQNIVLSKVSSNELSWNEYPDIWKNKTEKYDLFEKDLSQTSSTWNIVASFLDGTTRYNINNSENKCYKIVANENGINILGRTDTSVSNEVCYFGSNHIYYPTAFSPIGKNPTYIPRGMSIDYAKSTFTVYNRWGQIVYNTKDITKGWDGRFNNALCPQETYVVYAVTHFLDGKQSTCKTTIHLIL